MNWFKKALNISGLTKDTYFTTCTLPQFYQWQYSGTIPSKTRFSKKPPRSDIAISDAVLVVAQINPKTLKTVHKSGLMPNLYELILDTKADPHIVQGNIKTPKEIVTSHYQRLKAIDHQVDKFSKETSLGSFFVSKTKNATLHKTSTMNDNEIEVLSYGPLKNLFEYFEIVRKQLLVDAEHKKGRSKDWTTWSRFDNIMTTYNNGTIPLDLAKIEYLIKVSNTKPTNSHKSSWRDFYFTLFPEIGEEYTKINKLMSLGWVQEYMDQKEDT